jgi:two-component system, cell cycle sensor histidine kinase and response regulator CckA
MTDACGPQHMPVPPPKGVLASFDELVRRIPHGIYTLRVAPGGEMGFEYLSPQLCQLLGYDREAVLGDAEIAFRAIHPADLADLRAVNAAAIREGTPLRWEGRFDVRGETRWIRLEADQTVEPDGSVLWHGVVSDVTDRRLAEDRLRESEELYRRLAELAPNPITLADLEGRILFANPAALQVFGHVAGDEVVGRSIFEWVAPAGLSQARERFAGLFTAARIIGLELDFLRGDGSAFPGSANAALVRDVRGDPRLVIILVTDLTQRLHQEAERLKLQKLEAIGALAGGLAHDFNNLLQGVFGTISLARLKLGEPAEAAAILDQAERATSQAVSLTSQLLTFAKGGQPRLAPLALPGVVGDAARFALSGATTGFTLEVAPDLREADADEGQIRQVVQNIVMNASDAMQRAGTVRLDLYNVEVAPGSDEALPGGGLFAAIRIADDGPGVPPAVLPRIFDPYFTTKPRGSGLGLATAWSIVNRHGGAIRVVSSADGGAAFEVLLPAAPAAAATGAPLPAAPAVAREARRCRVLVMDDEEMVREVARAMIASEGHEVAAAADGDVAVTLVEQALAAGDPYDIVILDLTVRGGRGGDGAIGRIRALTPAVRAIVSSGYSDSAVMADYRAHGFDACLNKPYTIEALRAVLAALPAG